MPWSNLVQNDKMNRTSVGSRSVCSYLAAVRLFHHQFVRVLSASCPLLLPSPSPFLLLLLPLPLFPSSHSSLSSLFITFSLHSPTQLSPLLLQAHLDCSLDVDARSSLVKNRSINHITSNHNQPHAGTDWSLSHTSLERLSHTTPLFPSPDFRHSISLPCRIHRLSFHHVPLFISQPCSLSHSPKLPRALPTPHPLPQVIPL